MRWQDNYMTLLGLYEPLDSRLVLTKREAATLRKAAEILDAINDKLKETYGEDAPVYMPRAESWVMAECFLHNALEELMAGQEISLPHRDHSSAAALGLDNVSEEGS